MVVLEICSFANTSFISTKKLTTQQRHFQANTLLHPCAYVEECPLCNKRHKDIYAHLMITCPTTKAPKTKLQLKLALYKYPAEKLPPNKASLLVLARGNRTLRKWFLILQKLSSSILHVHLPIRIQQYSFKLSKVIPPHYKSLLMLRIFLRVRIPLRFWLFATECQPFRKD